MAQAWRFLWGLVIEELAALASCRLVRPEIYFWRTHAGGEVDLLIVEGRRMLPVEIKLGRRWTTIPLPACGIA